MTFVSCRISLLVLSMCFFGIFDLVEFCFIDPFFCETAVTANIAVNIDSGKNRRAYHNIIAGTICVGITVNNHDVTAAALGTHF